MSEATCAHGLKCAQLRLDIDQAFETDGFMHLSVQNGWAEVIRQLPTLSLATEISAIDWLQTLSF